MLLLILWTAFINKPYLLVFLIVYLLVTVVACKYSHFSLIPLAGDFWDRGVCVFVPKKLYADDLTCYCMYVVSSVLFHLLPVGGGGQMADKSQMSL